MTSAEREELARLRRENKQLKLEREILAKAHGLVRKGGRYDSSHQGQGFATEAALAVLRFSFEALGLHRVKAIVDRRNDPAVRLLRRAGMREEGLFLQHSWFKGSWCDEYVFALLAADWSRRR